LRLIFRTMLARFPHLSDKQQSAGEDLSPQRRLDWHALLARLQAERDLRGSFDGPIDPQGIASLLAEGSFDPRAAEMIITLAAGAGVSSDLGERSGMARLRNAKPSQGRDETQAAGGETTAEAGNSPPPPGDEVPE